MTDGPYVPRAGDRIADKYKVIGVIGEGGMGVVVSASHLHLDQPVAIKILRPDALERPETIARFLREARTTMKLKSEHVVRVFDVDMMYGSVPFIVMELLDGRDLASLVAERAPLGVEEAVSYVLQACEGIAEAHSLGIVHRDLKPANLFVTTRADGSPSVKVLDFGVSKVGSDDKTGTTTEPSSAPRIAVTVPADRDDALTQTNTTLGSPRYMAPEQLRSARDVDVRADIWALGTILYEALSGRVAFSGALHGELEIEIMEREPPALRSLRPSIPAALEQVVVRCLKKSPEERFADVSELADAIARFGGSAAEESAERIRRTLHGVAAPRKRRWRGGVGIAAAVAALAVAAGIAFTRERPAPKTAAIEKPREEPTTVATIASSTTSSVSAPAVPVPSVSIPRVEVRKPIPGAPKSSASGKARLDPGHAFDDPD